MKQLNIEVSDELHKELKMLAVKNGTSLKFEAIKLLSSQLNQME